MDPKHTNSRLKRLGGQKVPAHPRPKIVDQAGNIPNVSKNRAQYGRVVALSLSNELLQQNSSYVLPVFQRRRVRPYFTQTPDDGRHGYATRPLRYDHQ